MIRKKFRKEKLNNVKEVRGNNAIVLKGSRKYWDYSTKNWKEIKNWHLVKGKRQILERR